MECLVLLRHCLIHPLSSLELNVSTATQYFPKAGGCMSQHNCCISAESWHAPSMDARSSMPVGCVLKPSAHAFAEAGISICRADVPSCLTHDKAGRIAGSKQHPLVLVYIFGQEVYALLILEQICSDGSICQISHQCNGCFLCGSVCCEAWIISRYLRTTA